MGFGSDTELSISQWTDVSAAYAGQNVAIQAKGGPVYVFQNNTKPDDNSVDGALVFHPPTENGTSRPHPFLVDETIWAKASKPGCRVHVSLASLT